MMRSLIAFLLLAPNLAFATPQNQGTVTLAGITGTTSSSVIDLRDANSFSVQALVDVNTPAAVTFAPADVTVAANTVTEAAHGLFTGLKGQLTTVTTLPAGLSAATDYFVIVVDSSTFKLATSLANALAGTAVDITDQGVGDHTFTPMALADATVKVEKSNCTQAALDAGVVDCWVDIFTPTAISADATVWLEEKYPTYRWLRLQYTLTAGSLSTVNYFVVK
jgi:hypothetical protein